MSDFMFLFRAGEADRREAMGTPERAQRSLQTWLAWIRDLEAKGHLKEPGQPLNPEGKVVRGKKRMVTDGPYIEAKEVIASFSMIQADNYDAAVAIAKECPGDCNAIEIRELGGYA